MQFCFVPTFSITISLDRHSVHSSFSTQHWNFFGYCRLSALYAPHLHWWRNHQLEVIGVKSNEKEGEHCTLGLTHHKCRRWFSIETILELLLTPNLNFLPFLSSECTLNAVTFSSSLQGVVFVWAGNCEEELPCWPSVGDLQADRQPTVDCQLMCQ